jgi:hypothetical protein
MRRYGECRHFKTINEEMKMSKLLSILVASVFAVSTGSVFAASHMKAGAEKKEEMKKDAKPAEKKGEAKAAEKKAEAKPAAKKEEKKEMKKEEKKEMKK